ncbi:MAG: hypothetical protein JXP73_06495 [Deltaproteobacteria bacterium]|nr:hypothetical protein [Deltaproteobacteria bacterium]
MIEQNSRLAHHRFVVSRWLCLLVLVAGLPWLWLPSQRAQAQSGRPAVHVFLQLGVKSSALERELQARLPGLEVTVFGRFRDFHDAVNAGRPDAIACITPVLESLGKKPLLQGTRKGTGTEAYVLASVGKPLAGSLAGKTIGVVDLLDREGTQTFATGLLKTTDVKIKRVAKIEDLLPLLEFSAADGVLISTSLLAKFTERTRLPVKTRELPGTQVGLPAVAVLDPSVRDVVLGAFKNLDGRTKKLLGIDDWSTP